LKSKNKAAADKLKKIEKRSTLEEKLNPELDNNYSTHNLMPSTNENEKDVDLNLCFISEAVRNKEECLICLDEFTNENPMIFTLCACGENKVFFHYPCLLLYVEKKNECPNCGTYMYYQVFYFILSFYIMLKM
jgi:hypothetical protein